MATCAVSGTLLDSGGNPISGAVLLYDIQNSVAGVIAPSEVRTTSAADGTWSMNLSQGTTGILNIEYAVDSTDSSSIHTFNLKIPAASSASFASVWKD